jgi:hypothetical protein
MLVRSRGPARGGRGFAERNKNEIPAASGHGIEATF